MSEEKKYHPIKDTEKVIKILDKISIFGGLNIRQFNSVLSLLVKVHYEKGDYVFKQGQQPTHIYIIKKGEVKIWGEDEGDFCEVGMLGPGECFGQTSLIGIQPHTASVMATKDTELIVLSRESLMSIFKEDKELFGMLILNIAREACRLVSKIDHTLFHYVLKEKK